VGYAGMEDKSAVVCRARCYRRQTVASHKPDTLLHSNKLDSVLPPPAAASPCSFCAAAWACVMATVLMAAYARSVTHHDGFSMRKAMEGGRNREMERARERDGDLRE